MFSKSMVHTVLSLYILQVRYKSKIHSVIVVLYEVDNRAAPDGTINVSN